MVQAGFKYLVIALTSTFALSHAQNNATNSMNGSTGLLDEFLDSSMTDVLSKNESLQGRSGKNSSSLSDKFSVRSMYSNKACTGTPSSLIYSKWPSRSENDTCRSAPGGRESSFKKSVGVKDTFLDAMQRYGCNSSFVMMSKGKRCKTGKETPGSNVTSWVAIPADNTCHSTTGRREGHKQKHKTKSNSTATSDASKDTNSTSGGQKHSLKVELKDNTLIITKFKDDNCQQEATTTTINDKSSKAGDSLFCQDDHLFQVFDVSGKSSLFNSKISRADCKKNGGGDGKSTASSMKMSVVVSVLGFMGAISLQF